MQTYHTVESRKMHFGGDDEPWSILHNIAQEQWVRIGEQQPKHIVSSLYNFKDLHY